MASTEIQAAYATLTEAAALVQAERRQVKTLMEREFEFLVEQQERAKAAGIQSGPVLLNLFFRDMWQRRPIFYGFKDPSYDQLISGLAVSHNRQYQWLLVEAFELFEDFLLDAYACAGVLDDGIWTSQDLAVIGSYAGQPASWWVVQARSLKRPPGAKLILERLRQLSGVRDIEERNAHGIDFKFVLLMIERMRHVIVHHRGRVSSKDEFATAIASAAGTLAGGKPKPEDAAFVSQYFGNGRLNSTILLLEHHLPRTGPALEHIDMWDELLGWMLSYAHMLSQRL